MANTPNLNLVKPASTDNYTIDVPNGNMDIIDAAVKALQDGTTAAQVLMKILSVDGAGSGLDADKLDGQEGSYYRNADQVDGLHFRENSGVLEYSLDGMGWSPVSGLLAKASDNVKHSFEAEQTAIYNSYKIIGRIIPNFSGTMRISVDSMRSAGSGGIQVKVAAPTAIANVTDNPAFFSGFDLVDLPVGTTVGLVNGAAIVNGSVNTTYVTTVKDITVSAGIPVILCAGGSSSGTEVKTKSVKFGYNTITATEEG